MGNLALLNSMIKKINSYYCQVEQENHRSNCIESLLSIHVSTSLLNDSIPYLVSSLAKIFYKIII